MSVDELIGGPRRFERQFTARARVSRAPADVDDGLEVTLVNYSALSSYEIPASNWMPSVNLPAVDDECLVVFDDDGDAWVPVLRGSGDPVNPPEV